jgi:hypothetical protein
VRAHLRDQRAPAPLPTDCRRAPVLVVHLRCPESPSTSASRDLARGARALSLSRTRARASHRRPCSRPRVYRSGRGGALGLCALPLCLVQRHWSPLDFVCFALAVCRVCACSAVILRPRLTARAVSSAPLHRYAIARAQLGGAEVRLLAPDRAPRATSTPASDARWPRLHPRAQHGRLCCPSDRRWRATKRRCAAARRVRARAPIACHPGPALRPSRARRAAACPRRSHCSFPA